MAAPVQQQSEQGSNWQALVSHLGGSHWQSSSSGQGSAHQLLAALPSDDAFQASWMQPAATTAEAGAAAGTQAQQVRGARNRAVTPARPAHAAAAS
jgi:hypothetical protein